MMFFPGFDIIKSMAIDYMNAVLLGVIWFWFCKSNKTEPWYIGNQTNLLDQNLKNIRVPNIINILPRSFNDIGHWKASKPRNFLLFYSIPILWQTLPEVYFNHYILLVHSLYLLVQDTIDPSHLHEASLELRNFHLQIRSLYGERYQTFIAHNLLHLVSCVENLGPLWTLSCFYYEDYNGDLRHLFQGTQHIAIQIFTAVCFQEQRVNVLRRNVF